MEGSGASEEVKTGDLPKELEPLAQAEEVESLKDEVADEATIAQAEEFKKEGNEYFKNWKYQDAYEAYSKAVELGVGGKKHCIYLSNRAFASLKLENYGIAIIDAKAAIEIDPTFIKAYYRRGSAYFALMQLKAAIKDFTKVCKLVPKDKDARNKLDMAKKAKMEMDFASCIAVEEKKIEINPDDIIVEESYSGPVIEKREDVTAEWWVELMQYMKEEKKLHKKYWVMLLIYISELVREQPSLVDIEVEDDIDITVCGDTHGQYYDLLTIFERNGNPSETNPYLFNGDFVDRGSFSVEVMLLLMAWKVAFPNHMHLTRGNHESKNMNKMYGFEGEVKAKYDNPTMDMFSLVFCYLPIWFLINKKVLVMHGGLFSKDGVTIDDIRKVDRFQEPPNAGIMCDALWSDPCDNDGRYPSKRGVGCLFGPDVSAKFCEENNIDYVVRSHEVKMEGYEFQKGGKVITIFSAPNYCDQTGNKGAWVKFNGKEMKPVFTQFEAVPHPNKRWMQYANPLFSGMMG